MPDKRTQLDTQNPALVPATGSPSKAGDEPKVLPRSGDRDLDLNGVEQDDDGQPGTGLGPDETVPRGPATVKRA